MISDILEATRALGPDVTEPFPCTMAPHLFFDVAMENAEGRYHREEHAKSLCRICPVMTQCAEIGRDLKEPGIWGGTTEGERRSRGGTVRARSRTTRKAAGCGTPSGYKKHQREKTTICPGCRKAQNEAKAAQARRRRAARGKPVQAARKPDDCGTYAAAKRHVRRGEEVCLLCAVAMREYKSENKRENKRRNRSQYKEAA